MKPIAHHRKKAIVLTAIDIISAFGIKGLKEIAGRQNIAESTIFKHYASKNGSSFLFWTTQHDSSIIATAQETSRDPLDAIERVLSTHQQILAGFTPRRSAAL